MPQNRNTIYRFAIQAFFLALIFVFISSVPAHATPAAGINRTINFQGKVVNKADGTNLTNTTYSFIFQLYDDPTAGNQLPTGTPWSETQSLPVSDGIFRATLGSVTPIPTGVDFNSDTIYLSISFNGELFGSRIRLTAVPYAFNSEKVGGLTVTNTTGTLTIPSATTVTFSGANNLTFTTSALTSATLPSGTITLADTTSTQTLTGKTIGSTGLTFSGATTDITTGTNESFSIVPNGIGNVGIGLTTPTAKLHSLATTEQLRLGYDTSNYNSFTVGSAGSLTIAATGTNPGITLTPGGTGNITLATANFFTSTVAALNGGTLRLSNGRQFNWVYDANSLALNDATAPNNNLLYFNSAGNVGMGTSAPGAKLDVTGNATVSGNITMGGQLQVGRSGSDPTTLGNGSVVYNTTSNTFRCYQNGAWTNCIGAGGTPSWNTITAPTADLSLAMNSWKTTLTYGAGGSTGTNNLFNLTDTASNAGTGYMMNLTTAASSALKPFHVAAAGTEAILVNSAGNVGIGITIPTAKLDIYPNINSTKGLVVRGDNNGSSNIQEWQDGYNTVLASIDSNGGFYNNIYYSAPASNKTAINSTFDVSSGAGVNAGNHVAANINLITEGAGGFSSYQKALNGYLNHTGSGTLATGYGLLFSGGSTGNGNITNLVDVRAETYGSGTGVIANLTGFNTGTLDQYNTPTNIYAIDIGALTSGTSVSTSKYGIRIGSISGASTNNYAIFTNSGLNSLGDQLSIVGSADRKQLIVKGNSVQTNNLQEWQNSGASVLASIDKLGNFNTTGYATVGASLAVGNVNAPGGIGNAAFSGNLTAAGTTGLTLSGVGADLIFSGASGNNQIITASGIPLALMPGGTGNVGIGTTTPGAKLDVTGNATVSGNITMGGQLQVGRSGSDPTTLGNGSVVYNTTSNTFRCYQNGAWTNCIGAGGTPSWNTITAPTADLSLAMNSWKTTLTYGAGGSTGTNNLFNLTDTASNAGTGYMMNLTTAASSALKPFHVAAAGVESILVDATGNVGIGTTGPGAKLDVNGNISVQGNGTIDTRSAGSLTIGGGIQTQLILGKSGATTSLIGSNITLGGLAYGGTSNTLSFTGALSGILQANNTGAPTAITGTNNTIAKWSTSAPYLTNSNITDDGTTVTVGNGVGNILLTLNNENDVMMATDTATLSTNYSKNTFSFTRDLAGSTFTQGGSVLKVLNLSGSNNGVTNNPDMILVNATPSTGTFTGNLLHLQNLTVDKFTVDYLGNLVQSGIITANTTNTINGLSINSGAVLGVSTLGMSGLLSNSANGNAINLTGTNPVIYTTSTNRLDLTANSVTLSIGGTAGNIGIGTTAPTAKLDVNGNLNISGYATASASLAVGYASVPGGVGNAVLSGNVGIGTSAPISKLQIVGATGGNALALFNQNANADIITASSSGITRFTVTNKDVTVSGHKNNISAPGAVTDTFIYDTAGDMDGGRWTQDERAINSSWYNETLGTATRGNTKPFPRKAVITASASNVYIYDSKDNSLWMQFNQAANTALDVALNNTLTSVYALNGKIYVGTTGSAATGMYIIDFNRDQITRFNATDARDYAGDISTRNTSQTVAYANQSRTGLALVSSVVNDVRAAVINGKTYFAVATNGGANGSVTVINETDQVLVANLGPASIPSKQVWLTSTGMLYAIIANNASPTNYALKIRYNIPLALGNNLLFHEVYGNIGSSNYGTTTVDNNTFASLAFTAGPAPVDTTFIPNSLFVTQGTSIVDGKSNTIYIGNNNNLTVIQEKQGDTTNGLVKYYTNTYISGNLTGDIRGFYPLDTNVGSGLSDISVKGNTLTNGGTAPTYNVTGVRNYGASLGASAATAYSTGASLIIPVSAPLTVAAWFKPTTLTVGSGTREVFVSADANSANVVSWGMGTKGDGSNANIYCYAGNTVPTLFEVNTNIAAQTGNWYHVVLTSDASGNLKCYVNGVLSGTGTLTGTAQTPTRFQIGATQATTAMNAVRGTVDEVQVTAETASPALIKMSYDTGNRALNGHGAITLRGTSVSADQRQELNGASTQVNAVQADLEAGRIYVGTAGGGVTVLGIQSDTINDIFTTAALDETGAAMGSNTINGLSIGKGYGTNSFVAIGHGAGEWIETIDTNIKDFLSNGYNPFGSTLTQSNLNVDTVFKVTNPVTSRLDNIAGGVGTGNQPAMNDIFRVDSNGAFSGLNMTVGSRTDYTQSGFNPAIQAAGTFGADSGVRGATSSAVFKGKLFVATNKANAAGVYRYDGGGLWTLVTAAVGKVLSGDSAIVTGYAMTVWNNQLVIGTQTTPTNGLASIYVSSNADTGTATTTTWTLLNTTQGRFNTTTGIGGVSDLAVYNGVLYLITDHPKKAEIYRYLGGTGTSVFTKTSANATTGAVCASDAGDANGGMFQIAGGRLYVGLRTAPAATARVCYYDGTSTNPDVDWKVLNSTRGAFGGYAGGAATTGMIDVTGMAVYNGELWVTAVKAANSLEIYRLKGNPSSVPAGAADFQRINTTVGRVLSSLDTTVSDGAVIKAYQGRMYLGTQTGTDSLAALYEFEPSVADNFTLVNTTRGTFGAQSSVDDVTVLQPYNDPTNPNGGAVLFIGTNDVGGNAGVYSWIKYLAQSNALKMDSGSSNLGSIMFTSDDQTYDNAARSGKFVFSHAVNLSTGAFDYAEDYPTNDPSIEAGDIVAVDKQNKEFVVKGNKNQPVLGVVSENPGFRLSQSADKINGNNYIPIALVGRVPVKVNTENGPIKAGDYLTISSFTGVAMKATKAGAVIGQAMEDYNNGGVGKITVYVQTGQINGASIIDALPGLTNDQEAMSVDPTSDSFGKRILNQLMINKNMIKADDLSQVVTDRVVAGLEVITPQLITDRIITNALSIFGEGDASTSALTQFDNKGNATFAGTLTVDTLKANHIEGLDIMFGSLKNINSQNLSATDILEASVSGALEKVGSLSERMDKLEQIALNASDSGHINTNTLLSSNSNIASSSSGLTLLGNTTVFGMNIIDKLTLGLLTIESDASASGSIQTAVVPLKLQKDSLGNLEIMGSKIVIDTFGNMIVKESITAKDLKANRITILDEKDATSGAVLSSSAGKSEITIGETAVKIKTSALTDKSLIFATPENKPTGVAAKKLDDTTIEISIASPLTEVLKVNWWIIN